MHFHSVSHMFTRLYVLAGSSYFRSVEKILGFVSHLQYPLGKPNAGQPGSDVGLDQGSSGLPALLVSPILARGLLLLQEAALRRRTLRAEHPRALDRGSLPGRRVPEQPPDAYASPPPRPPPPPPRRRRRRRSLLTARHLRGILVSWRASILLPHHVFAPRPWYIARSRRDARSPDEIASEASTKYSLPWFRIERCAPMLQSPFLRYPGQLTGIYKSLLSLPQKRKITQQWRTGGSGVPVAYQRSDDELEVIFKEILTKFFPSVIYERD